MTSTLDYLTDAVQRELREPGQWSWTFHHCMDAAAKLKFDGFLVRTGDELAYQAGTVENRFKTRVLRMAELERERRKGAFHLENSESIEEIQE